MGIDTGALVERLPERFVGAGDLHAETRYRISAGAVTRDVVVSQSSCTVESPRGTADAEIRTDARTWADIFAGRLSGIEAFGARRLVVRGSIERALRFEPLFERPDAGGLRYSITRVRAGRVDVSTLVAGSEDAPPLVLVHGLGATKASWLTVIPALARHHRVIAIDLPGFGDSSKPIGAYDAAWFARHVGALIEVLGYDDAFVAGNSMGGRIAMEMAMTRPDTVRAIACLCPAAAFSRRPAIALVRLLRPEFGMMLGRLPRRRLVSQVRTMFADPRCIDDDWYEAAIDDFLQIWRSPRARIAFFTSARNIYLEEPEGEEGFWARLRRMETPALYVYGQHDVLITPRFARKVGRCLPKAEVVVWPDCGHVPQLEHPERTVDLVTGFFTRTRSRRSATAR